MTADVDFVDGQSGELVGRYHVESSTHSGVTGAVIDETVDAILEILKETYSISGP